MKSKRLLASLVSFLLFFVILLAWARFNIGPTVSAARISPASGVSDGIEPTVRKSSVHPIMAAYLTLRPRLADASVQENALILEGAIFLIVGLIWSRTVREKSV